MQVHEFNHADKLSLLNCHIFLVFMQKIAMVNTVLLYFLLFKGTH